MKGLKVIIMTTLYKMSIENKRNGELFVKNYNTRSEVVAEILTLWKHKHGAESFTHQRINVNELIIESYISDLDDEDWIIRVYKTNEKVVYRFDTMVNDFYEIDTHIKAEHAYEFTYFNNKGYIHLNKPGVKVYENTYGDIVVKISYVAYHQNYGKIDELIVVDYLMCFDNEDCELIDKDGNEISNHYLLNSDLDKYKKVRIFNVKG